MAYWISVEFLIIASLQGATAQLSLSTPTGVQCYGRPVSLVCTHPVLPQEPEYRSGDVDWSRDGRGIPVGGLGLSELNSTTTRLQFTITEDTIGNYTCFITNAVRGGINESNSVSVRPLDLTPAHITTMDPLESSITVRWTPQPCAVSYRVSWNCTNDGTTTTGSRTLQLTTITLNCPREACSVTVSVQAVDGVSNVGPATSEVVKSNLTSPNIMKMDPLESSITVRWTPQPCAVRYRVSWMYTNDDGTTTTGSGVSDQVTSYTIPTSVQGVYTVSVQAVDGVGNVGPATSEVARSTYPRPTTDAPPCEDGSLVLTCQVGGLHNDRRSLFMWIDRNSNLTNSNVYSMTGDQLMIANVSTLSDEEDKAIRCCEVLNNGIIVEGVEYKVEPLAQPGPPEVTVTTTTDSTITLTWNTALRCFESEMFIFVVIWNKIGSGTSSNVTTSSSPYTISGLQPDTSYQISVQGVGGSGVAGGTTVLNVTTTSTTTTPVWLPVVIVLVLLALIFGIAMVVCYNWLKRKHNHKLQKAKDALSQIFCCCKKEPNSEDNEEINVSPVQATSSTTGLQGSDPVRSADSSDHLPGYNHQLVSEVPPPLPQEVQKTVCVGYSCIRILGYNSFGMDSNDTADCISIGQSHNRAKGGDPVLSPVNQCSMTVFVAQLWNHLLPNFNMPDALEYSWNI